MAGIGLLLIADQFFLAPADERPLELGLLAWLLSAAIGGAYGNRLYWIAIGLGLASVFFVGFGLVFMTMTSSDLNQYSFAIGIALGVAALFVGAAGIGEGPANRKAAEPAP